MPDPAIVGGVFAALTALGVAESRRHRRHLGRVPVRIHVNGTRGKSSVARLIGAGLRAGGRRTVVKTTGTLPRLILPDGREQPIFRPGRPNVVEQISIVRAAARLGADALVIECMALKPAYQWLSESRFVRATHGVITNCRADHLDVMGPTEADVTRALAGMVPPGRALYTAERTHLPILAAACADRRCDLIAIGPEQVDGITTDDLAGFGYREHPENLALALAVCADLGIDRRVALDGMWAATPDPGAMTEHVVEVGGKRITFINGFAANDPQSTRFIWEDALARHAGLRSVALFNCRADRGPRSRQLGEAYGGWPPADHLVLMGSRTRAFARAAIRGGVPAASVVTVEGPDVQALFDTITRTVGGDAMVMGMGNIGGPGLELVDLFAQRARQAAA